MEVAFDFSGPNPTEKLLRLTQRGVDCAADGFVWLLPSAKIFYVNDAACRMLGCCREELLGKTLPDIETQFSAEAWPAHWRELTEKQSLTFQSDHRTRDARLINTEVTVSLVRFDDQEYACAIMRDISERKLAEAERGWLAAIVEGSSDAIISRDLDLKVLTWNGAAERMLGYDASQAIGRSVDFIIPPHRQDIVTRRRESLTQGEAVPTHDTVLLARDGRLVDVSVTQSPIRDTNGRMIAVSLTMRDITARKQAENALRENERRLTEAQTIAHLGSWDWDVASGRNSWSDENFRIFGYQPGAVEASYDVWADTLHPDDRNRVIDHVYAALDGRVAFDIEHRVCHPNGEIRHVHARGEVLRDASGVALRMVGTVLDITERKRAEIALRAARDELERRVHERTEELLDSNALLSKSEEWFRQAIEVADLGIFEHDFITDELSFSPRFKKMLDWPANLRPTSAEFIKKVHPDDREQVLGAVRQAHDPAGDGRFACEYRVLRRSGTIGWLLVRSQVFFDGPEGARRMVRGVGAALDITERKRAEEAMRNLNEQLDQRVAERTSELAESRSRLTALVTELTRAEERERRRLAVQLHDYLAQSLALVRINVGRAGAFVNDPARSEVLKELLTETQTVLDESIDYTRTLIADLSPRVLYDVGFPAALSWLGEQMGRHGLQVEVDAKADARTLAEDDAVLLFQCARELLWNVVKHGGAHRAKVFYSTDGDHVSLVVTDEGNGFDVQAFKASGGEGHFGLFSIKERVELRGGTIEIASTPCAGTKVGLVLSMDRPTEANVAMDQAKTITTAPSETINIVIVDDHKMLRQGLRRVLEEAGPFTIVGEASDGAAAIAQAKVLQPHVVIMDVNLPVMSGIDATQVIMRELPSTIVIGLSFGSDAYVARAMHEAGAVACIAKERAVEDVRQSIMDAVEARRALAASSCGSSVENRP